MALVNDLKKRIKDLELKCKELELKNKELEAKNSLFKQPNYKMIEVKDKFKFEESINNIVKETKANYILNNENDKNKHVLEKKHSIFCKQSYFSLITEGQEYSLIDMYIKKGKVFVDVVDNLGVINSFKKEKFFV